MNQNGLYSITLVKTAHKLYPKLMFKDANLSRGEWATLTGTIENVELLAVQFMDLKLKQFISSTSTSLEGAPRVTKHHGEVSRPTVAVDYLRFAAGIDIHNHVRTGSLGFEDVWKTHNYIHRQFAGIFGFLFTNAYLAFNYFEKKEVKHTMLKIALSNQMTSYDDVSAISPGSTPVTRNSSITIVKDTLQVHIPKKYLGLRAQRACFICHHANELPKRVKTCYYCLECGPQYAICSPLTTRNCFTRHISEGISKKRRYIKSK